MPALLLSDDLMDASRVTAQARAEGRSVSQVRTFQELLIRLPGATCLLIDLHHPELNLPELMAKAPGMTLIGYGSHVDAARLKSARQAGVSLVMPRSQFFDEVRTELKNWLGD